MIIHEPYAGEQGEDWEIYKHYEKRFCDIRLKNGEEYGACWPNAGFFTILEEPERQIPQEQVAFIRYYKED